MFIHDGREDRLFFLKTLQAKTYCVFKQAPKLIKYSFLKIHILETVVANIVPLKVNVSLIQKNTAVPGM